MVVKFLVRKR